MDSFPLEKLNDFILDSLDVGVLVVDLTSHLIFLNREGERILQTSREAFRGCSILTDSCFCPFVVLVNEHRKEGPTLTQSKRFVPAEACRPDGTRIPLSVVVSNLVDEKDTVLGYVLVFRDVTQLQELEERARRSEKLAALGTVAAGVAHEVRNPLHTIHASMELLEIYHQRGQDIGEYVHFIYQEVATLERLVEDILSFSREVRLRREAVDLEELVVSTLAGLSLPDLVTVEKVDTGALLLPLVEADPERIRQVLRNLIRNAVEAQPDGGEVRVSVSSGGRRCLPFSPGKVPFEFLQVRVEDSGPGISAEHLPHLFEPFFTKRRKGEGTGLGLGICQKIVEAHNGFLEVETKLGQGSCFSVLLPLKLGDSISQEDLSEEELPPT
jgi:PAS domain S-box-containing protein